jgi:hypothetical protein
MSDRTGMGEGGNVVRPRKRRRSGSTGSLKSALWAIITYNLDVIEDTGLDHEVRQKACHCLTQASLAWSRIVEQHDMARQMTRLERLAQGNGHHG